MSRGPGHVERAIERLFVDNPDAAFLIADLVAAVFHRRLTIEKRHRVSIGRAAKHVAERRWWGTIWWNNSLVYHNKLSVVSYRTARGAGCGAGYRVDPSETMWQLAARWAEGMYKSSDGFRLDCDRSVAAWQAEHDGRLEDVAAICAEMQRADEEREAHIARALRNMSC
jgi:hypothetical protein